MRSISTLMRTELYKQRSGNKVLIFVTLTHPDKPGTYRMCNEATTKFTDQPLRYGTVSNGNNFDYREFDIMLPDDVDKRGTSCQLVIENLTRGLVAFLRTMPTPGKCTIQLAMASTPNSYEFSWVDLDINGVSGNIQYLTVEFGMNRLDREPVPAGKFLPAYFPGLHGIVI